jgi:hypothetical protein
MLFLKSHSGSAFVLLVVFFYDCALNTLGISSHFIMRLLESAKGIGLSETVAFAASALFSAFASAALGLALMQCALNNITWAGRLLGALSFIISAAGLMDVAIKPDDYILVSGWVKITMIAGLSIIPPVVYSNNAALVVSKIGAFLDKVNKESDNQLDTSITAQLTDLGSLDAAETRAKVDKRKQKIRRPVAAVEKPELSTIDLDQLLKTL